MILWLTGNSGAGKTTLARRIAGKNTIVLDGDEMRASISTDLGLSEIDRTENCMRIARLAMALEAQRYCIVVAAICPYQELRNRIQELTDCIFVYVPGGKEGPEFPYEVPFDALLRAVH